LKNLPRSQARRPVRLEHPLPPRRRKPSSSSHRTIFRGNADSEASTELWSAGMGASLPGRHARLRTNRRGSRAHGSRVGLGYGGVAFETRVRRNSRKHFSLFSMCLICRPLRQLLRGIWNEGAPAVRAVGSCRS